MIQNLLIFYTYVRIQKRNLFQQLNLHNMDELDKFLKDLRSVVVSSPVPVDLHTLESDYRELLGQPMPLQRFGYESLLTFLRERCTDSFVLQGPTDNPIVVLIVPKALEHIDNMVRKQKLSEKNKGKGKRWSITNSQPEAKEEHNVEVNKVDGKPKKGQTTKWRSSSSGNERHGCVPRGQDSVAVDSNRPSSARIWYSTSRGQGPSVDVLTKQLTERTVDYPKSLCTSDSIKNDRKGNRWSKTNSQPGAKEEHNVEDNKVDGTPKKGQKTKSGRGRRGNERHGCIPRGQDSVAVDSNRPSSARIGCTASSGQALSIAVLAKQLTELIADYPEGLWSTELIKNYRERFKQDLYYERYNVSSGIALLRLLEGTVFHVRRPDPLGEYRVYDARRTPPPDDDAGTRAVEPAPSPPPTSATASDAMLFMDTIRPESVAAFESGNMIDVLVGEIYSPSHFWLIRRDEMHCGILFAIKDAMAEYYDGAGAERRLADEMEVRPGLYCAARHDNKWLRALILQFIDPDTVLLRYIDNGTVGRVPVASLKPLLKCWGGTQLAAQALRARLGGVMPPSQARHWPHTSSAEFLKIVYDQAFVAVIVAIDYEESIIEVYLVNTSAAKDVCVNELMVDKGFAVQRFDSVIGKIESYLRPTFAALESGMTLSYAEICSFVEHGLNLSCIDSYRQHVLEDPPHVSPMPPLLMRAAGQTPLPTFVSKQPRFLTTRSCLAFGILLPTNYSMAVDVVRKKLRCQCEPETAHVWLKESEYQHVERLSECNVARAALYLDKIFRARLPPPIDYPAETPSKVLDDAQ